MPRLPVHHIGVVLPSSLASSRDAAFACAAVNIQLRDVCRAWHLPSCAVVFYGRETYIPAREGAVIACADSDGNPDTNGMHGIIGGTPFAIVDLRQAADPWAVLSHECAELPVNPYLDLWVTGPDGLKRAVEVCDPVQRSYYEIEVEIFGERRFVKVSNFVLPAYFSAGSEGPWDRLGDLSGPFDIFEGGYQIAQKDGVVTFLGDADAAAGKAATSRTQRAAADALSPSAAPAPTRSG